ncbi:MAG: methionine ABC transporter permease [Coprobacillaceae bacterium]
MLNDIFPNLEKASNELINSTFQTLQMLFISGILSFIFGILLGIALIVTRPKGILENRFIYNILDKLINIIRSIPFLILMVLLIPLSRSITGTAIGVLGSIIPLACGTIPFFARQVETALAEVDTGLIEASQAMGLSPSQIIIRVYLRESIPTITRVTMITAINLIGLTAMAGAIGAGGLGDFAIRYGHQQRQTDLLWLTIGIILVIVSIIQFIGNRIIKHTTH